MIRFVALAALAGSAIGATLALAEDRPTPAPRPVAVVATEARAAETPKLMPARDVIQLLEVPDSGGAAPWAVRRFTGPKSVSCFELGRLDHDRFGWIDGTGTFTPARAGYSETPVLCHSARFLEKLGANTQRLTLLSRPEGASPQPARTVSWGIATAEVKTILPKDGPPIMPGENGLFVQVRNGEDGAPAFTGKLEHRDGTRTTFNRAPEMPPGARGERSVEGTGFVAARAPDPAGAEPWGIIASRGGRGGLCLSSPERLVGTRLGYVDRRLDLFFSSPFAVLGGCISREPTRGFPMRIDTLVAGGFEQDPRGRVERRVESTRIVFWGRVHKDVVSVTIRTPRDVRTLLPTSPAHAILAVYDGRFPAGKVTATARCKDGREVTRTLYAE